MPKIKVTVSLYDIVFTMIVNNKDLFECHIPEDTTLSDIQHQYRALFDDIDEYKEEYIMFKVECLDMIRNCLIKSAKSNTDNVYCAKEIPLSMIPERFCINTVPMTLGDL